MKYILMFVSEGGLAEMAPDELAAMYAQVGEWWGKHSASGAILAGEQLEPAATATTVNTQTGAVTDGPFLEAKESVGGYAVIDVPDLDAAIAMARTWPASRLVEIRPLVPDPPH